MKENNMNIFEIHAMKEKDMNALQKEVGIEDFKEFEIDTDTTTFGKLIIDDNIIRLFVPPYQRLYDWKEIHCKTLLIDLWNSIKDRAQHFFGDMSFHNKSRASYSITDGQQRTTTLMLIALAVLAILKNDKKKYEKEIESFTSLLYNGKNALRITLNKNDNMLMDALIAKAIENDSSKLDELSDATRQASNIEKNYIFIKKEITKYINNGGNIMSLFNAIFNLKIVMVICPVENAQIIYASKNTKGLPLSQVDQIKNLLMEKYKKENKQNEIVDNYWIPIQENVEASNMSDFIMDTMIVMATRENIKVNWALPNKMFQNMVDFIKAMPGKDETEKATKVLDFMLHYSKLYKKYINIDTENYSMANNTPLMNNLYVYEHIFGGHTYNSIILYLLDMYEARIVHEATLVDVMDSFVNVQCRAKIIGQFKGAQRKNAPAKVKILNEIFKTRKTNKLDNLVWEKFFIGNGYNYVPSDVASFSYLANNPQALGNFDNILKKDNLALRYILYRMNLVASKGRGIPAFDKNKCKIEHIVCQNHERAWQETLKTTNKDIADRYVHQFGNLTLVSNISDRHTLAEKKPIYANSDYILTKEIATIDKWNGKVLYERTKYYAELFTKAFPVPAEFRVKITAEIRKNAKMF